MESPTLDPDLIKRAVNFHGQQLQKIWDSEGGDFLKTGNLEFDFSVYQERQKHLCFQDRGKRLKIQHFIARNAERLFDASNLPSTRTPPRPGRPLAPGEADCYAVMPNYDNFLPLEKSRRLQHYFQCVQPGELLICSVTSRSGSGLMLKVLCTDSTPFRYVADLNVKAFCPMTQMAPGAVVMDKKGTMRSVMLNEAVRVELLEVVPDSEKMVVSMQRPAEVAADPSGYKPPPLGLVYTEDLPVAYKRCLERKGESFSELLEQSLGFANPSNTELLFNKAGISQDTTPSFMKSLRSRFPVEEYAQELRQVQAGKWAFKSVAEGITHFKANRHSEAFQCLNRALSIDRRNVEGLVARGALYANSGSFKKAIEDFEMSLKLNPNHQNAKKYMGETLVALGRLQEEENKFDEALKSYERCLVLVPFHEEAQNSIHYLQKKMGSSVAAIDIKLAQDPLAVNPSATDDLLPGGLAGKSMEMKATLKQLLKEDEKGRSSRSKKKKDRKRKRRHRSSKRRRRDRSSSSSSTSSSGSASSSSSSSSSSGSGSSGDRGSSRSGSASPRRGSKHRKSKKHHQREAHREKSLSPLSKRAMLMDTSHDSDGLAGMMPSRASGHFNTSSTAPYSFDDSASMSKSSGGKESETELRLRAFLEQIKGDPNCEEKLRKFLDDAKWKKDQKSQEKESKKKKKKDKSKSREKEKSKKKKTKEEDKRRKRRSRKSEASEPGEPSLAEQLEKLDESGRRIFKEALLAKLQAQGGKGRRRSESSSEDQEEQDAGMVYTTVKKQQREKAAADISRMLEIPDLDDIQSKLKSYYAKVEKDKGLSSKSRGEEKKRAVKYPTPPVKAAKATSPKLPYSAHEDDVHDKRNTDMFADSPSPPPSKGKLQDPSNVVSPKWKMMIQQPDSKVKQREHRDKEPWEEVDEKRFIFMKEGREEGEASSGAEEPASRHHAAPRRSEPEPPVKELPPPVVVKPTETYYDKFTGFRMARKPSPKIDPALVSKTAASPAVPGKDSSKGLKTESDSEMDPRRKRMKKSRSRSHSSSSRSRARSSGSSMSGKRRRSRSGSYHRRSRSGSYRYGSRSRSRSYVSRSRSRSRSRSYDRSRSRTYDSRSRSGSGGERRRSSDYYRRGSRSPDRYRRYDNGHNMRYPRQRGGTYYRPRFQHYKSPRGYIPRGRGGYIPRGGRPYIPRMRGRGRPPYYHNNTRPYRPQGYRPDHHRRYSGSRERSMDRRSFEERDRDREVMERDRERPPRREEDRRSEEPGGMRKRERDPHSDPEHHREEEYAKHSGEYIDRKMFEGKWAEDREEEKRRSGEGMRHAEEGGPPPGAMDSVPEHIEDMDKFLTKVKAQKKEEMKERNKSFMKPNPW